MGIIKKMNINDKFQVKIKKQNNNELGNILVKLVMDFKLKTNRAKGEPWHKQLA